SFQDPPGCCRALPDRRNDRLRARRGELVGAGRCGRRRRAFPLADTRMSEDPRDPSPLRGRRPIADAEKLRAILRDRLARSRYASVDCALGFVLTVIEDSSGAAGSYGYVAAVTPTDAIALTPALVRATKGRTLYMLGCMRSSLTVPDTCVE